jgi:hypothetical protein
MKQLGELFMSLIFIAFTTVVVVVFPKAWRCEVLTAGLP